MKKVLLAILLFAGIGISNVHAQWIYKVSVSVQVIRHYYNDSNHYDQAFETTSQGQSQPFDICAETPDQAKEQAKYECSSACSRSGRDLGRQSVNGQYYYVTEERRVYDATATRTNTKCGD